jgi:hypothetical protein
MNDRLRQHHVGGRVMMTRGIAALGPDLIARIDQAIRAFDAFATDNDPYGEHDFGLVQVEGHSVMFNIDAYDVDLDGLSPDPSDQAVSRPVMTLMLAEEY